MAICARSDRRNGEQRTLDHQPHMQKRAGIFAGPLSEAPSQGDNPNIALTRPQNTRPLTLVGE
jgi:hypothetical protein